MNRLAAIVLAASAVLTAQTPSRPRILGIAHIAVFAKNFEASRTFYRDFLGFAEPYFLARPDGSPSMAFFKVNERQYIELSPETSAGTDRLNHISIETDDAEAMRRYLASRGIAVPERVGKGRIGNSNFNVKDPQGHTLEIVQYEKDGWTERARGRHLPAARVSAHMSHVGIIVTAFEPAMRFYRDVLGFRETWRGSSTGNVLSWVNLQTPDGPDYIELMLYKEAPAPDRRGTAHHLCLEVPNMQASVAALEASPFRKLHARAIESKVGINRKRQANLYDPDGTRAELMEPDTVDGVPAPSSQAPPPDAGGLGAFEGHGDVGTVLHAGSVEFDSAKRAYTLSGSGANMWATADAFHFVWKKVSGDVSISADVAILGSGGDAHRKAALLIRQSLDEDSAYIDAALHGDGLASLQARETKGAATHEIQSSVAAPKRLRLTKRGQYAYMSIAAEGQEFRLSGGWLKIPLQGPFYLGLGVCAHNKDAVERAVFSNVEISVPRETNPPAQHSTVETVVVASTDRRASFIAPGRIESAGWADGGKALEFQLDGQAKRVEFSLPQSPAVALSANSAAPLPEDGMNNGSPQLSPDGTRVVFLSAPKEAGALPHDKEITLRMMTLADKRVRVLASFVGGPGSLAAPAWSPDGRRVVFVSYQFIP